MSTCMIEKVGLVMSPYSPGLETAFGALAITAFGDRSDRSVTLLLDPAVEHYEEQVGTYPGLVARQLMMAGVSENSRNVFLDLDAGASANIEVGGRGYRLTLLSVGTVQEDGQDFPCYYLEVEAEE